MKRLAPSILSADFAKLGSDVKMIEDAGAHLVHVDVMDGHFVPNITIGPLVAKSLVGKTGLPLDVHLMIEDPDKYIAEFATPQTEFITVHQEACTHLHRTVQAIKALGVKAGVALNPATPPETLEYVLGDIDMVLVMSVNPGFGGQKMILSAVEKIAEIRSMLDRAGSDAIIEVDGGVNEKTEEVLNALQAEGVRAERDTRDMSPGWKFNEWEMKGVPIRIEIGPRDLERGEAVLFRRDTLAKESVKIDEIPARVEELLTEIQKNMLEKSRAFRDSRVKTVHSLDEMLAALDAKNFTKAAWCGDRACEDAIKEKTNASSRVMVEGELVDGKCVCCGKPAKKNVLFARAY